MNRRFYARFRLISRDSVRRFHDSFHSLGMTFVIFENFVRFPSFLRLISEGGETVSEFETIYRNYFRDVELYLRAICHDESLAEELTEQVFFQALKALPKFRGDCDIRTWLCAMARNCYLSHLRKTKPTEDIEEVP